MDDEKVWVSPDRESFYGPSVPLTNWTKPCERKFVQLHSWVIMRLGFLPGLGTVKDLFSGECLKAVSKVQNWFQTLLLHAWIVPEPVHLLHKILLQWGKPYLKIRQMSIANVTYGSCFTASVSPGLS